jgi:hypothetical protein
MQTMKHTATTPQPAAERINELQVAIASLRQHGREALDETIALENAGAVPKEKSARVTPQDRADVRLNGHAGPPRSANQDEHLWEVLVDRQGIELAITELERQLFDAQADAFREWMGEGMKHWAVIQKKRARALLELRDANRAAAAFRIQAQMRCPGSISLPADRISGQFSQSPVVGGAEYTFLQSCVREGFISADEIGPWSAS